ncbi:hypothetical protein TNCT_693241 [Trichonephila clavata]|uniref:Uncharacterized protein n=1 Tax=Trichonephila clavata TaxID=2740835 RepID=A0A8X6J828_TRICU|nr:hypothetical protein TNCT_693241 [Trichonephila clavata]
MSLNWIPTGEAASAHLTRQCPSLRDADSCRGQSPHCIQRLAFGQLPTWFGVPDTPGTPLQMRKRHASALCEPRPPRWLQMYPGNAPDPRMTPVRENTEGA